MRLTNGTSEREGRVEVKLNGTWASVMSSFGFKGSNARVVCRQLGYGGGTLRGVDPVDFGHQLITTITCRGTETDLNGCSWATTYMTSGDVLSVACEGERPVLQICPAG